MPRGTDISTPDPLGLLLVLTSIVSVQFGSALAATLVPHIGAGGSVVLRLGLASLAMLALARPHLRGHGIGSWRTVVAFGASLAVMNLAFYASLAHLPMGVAVPVEFLGPLTLTALLARRRGDLAAVALAAVGVALISEIATQPWSRISWTGLGLALLAGVGWASYIVFAGRAGTKLPGFDGLALAMLVSAALALPFGATSMHRWTAQDVALGACIALLSSLLPHAFEFIALRRLDTRVFGILLALEPGFGAFAGWLVLHQGLDPIQLVGIGLVVAASVMVMGQRRAPAAAAG